MEILTIAIGDGGNELGMGKVHEEIITTIPEGDQIGTCNFKGTFFLCLEKHFFWIFGHVSKSSGDLFSKFSKNTIVVLIGTRAPLNWLILDFWCL